MKSCARSLLILLSFIGCGKDESSTQASLGRTEVETGSVESAIPGQNAREGGRDMQIASEPQRPTELNEQEKKYLLALARSALEGTTPPAKPDSKVIDEPLGAFVTLKKKGDLRGCIGFIFPQGPISREIPILARKAAYEDPRFLPITTDEIADLKIDISIMTRLWEMKSPDEIIVGTHGLYILYGNHGGILLPQVATEFGVDRYGFLDMVCQKAGLPLGAWKDPKAKIYLFAATVFGE